MKIKIIKNIVKTKSISKKNYLKSPKQVFQNFGTLLRNC